MRRLILITLLVAVLLAVSIPMVGAQSGGIYTLTWSTIDGGGTQGLSGGTYTLSGTAGQFDAGTHNNGSYALAGGFWQLELFGYQINLPLIRK